MKKHKITMTMSLLASWMLTACGGGGGTENDTVAPVITLSGNDSITIEATTSYIDAGATAMDNKDGLVTVITSNPVDTSQLGNYTITYEAKDISGNVSTLTRVVHVVDTTPPTINLVGSNTVSIAQGSTFFDPGVTANDSYEGEVLVNTSGSVNTNILGSYTINYTAVDSSGNSATAKRIINVVKPDTTPPNITLHGNSQITVEAGTEFIDPGASASDNNDGDIAVTTTGDVIVSTVGSYTIIYSATDSSGNSSSVARVVHIIDTTAPAISVQGNEIDRVEAGFSYIDAGAVATDIVDGSVDVVIAGNVNTSMLGRYTITYTAIDSAGNTNSAYRVVDVTDTIAPVVTLSGNTTIEQLASEDFTDPGATALDSFEGILDVTTTGIIDTNTPGNYNLTYTATDSSGNSSSQTRTVIIHPSIVLNVEAKNYFTGEVIDRASISVSSSEDGNKVTRTGRTDSNGHLLLAVSRDAQRIVVSGDADGFGEYSKIITSTDQTVDIFLQPVNKTVTFSPTTDSNLDVSGINVVTLAANSLVDNEGNMPTGNIIAEVTVIDPSIDTDLMPGNFETINSTTGEVEQIESFGAMNVTFTDENGINYNVASGQTATIRIPLASDVNSPPNTIPLYHFNEDTGYWIEEGSATLISSNGQTYYEGTVPHFSTWNADKVYQSVKINGCVKDSENNSVQFAEITTKGVNYSGSARTLSSNQGNFSIAAKSNSTVLLSANTTRGLSRTITLTTGDIDINQTECIQLEDAAAVVTLTWGKNPSDLDTHFFGPSSVTGEDAFHVFYRHRSTILDESNIWLDVDDTSGFGPEITTITSFPYIGRYTYAVYKYSGSSDIANSPARVELNYNGRQRAFSPPQGDPTSCWAVFDFVVDEQGTVIIEPLNSWESSSYCHSEQYTPTSSTQGTTTFSSDNFFMPSYKNGILKELIEQKYYTK
ncbi:immunoglobulin-like domain-containing protein [Vibrio navarrensis]|uniref:immunoglobulin-like domain-containing protein n=1 Tax=Vibrio navarrensis TaxID=29495 RepID=UPI0018DD0F77|nr:immunoglobulin-like domain-containing protein [Vibrio navarrensis]MBH9742248.1 hypothetical protein [Vibrio navarrensis]